MNDIFSIVHTFLLSLTLAEAEQAPRKEKENEENPCTVPPRQGGRSDHKRPRLFI